MVKLQLYKILLINPIFAFYLGRIFISVYKNWTKSYIISAVQCL